MKMVTRHWSGKHHWVVQGINLITTLWTDGTAIGPIDVRIYYPEKYCKTKNDHFRDMLQEAKKRGFIQSVFSSIPSTQASRT